MHVIRHILPELCATKVWLKTLACTVMLLIYCCAAENKHDSCPDFRDNDDLESVWEPIQNIVRAKDFSVSYSVGPSAMATPESRMHRIFAFNGSNWEKIELRQGIIEVDSSMAEFSIVEKDITIKKECDSARAKYFLNSLIELGLFELNEEITLVDRCASSMQSPIDSPTIFFYIVKGNDIRILSYRGLSQKVEGCPEVSEWSSIHGIISLFENGWIDKY
jgi:hypothetical protein